MILTLSIDLLIVNLQFIPDNEFLFDLLLLSGPLLNGRGQILDQ